MTPVWQLIDSRGIGGIESHVLQLSLALQQHGVSVTVVWLKDYGPHPIEPVLRDAGVTLCKLNGSLLSFWSWLQKQDAGVLHTHGYKAGLIGRLLGRVSGCRVISSFHAGEPGRGRVRVWQWLDEHSAMLADQRIVISTAIAERLPCPSLLLNNFVALPAVTNRPGRARQIAFVGRLSPEKGPDDFARIAADQPHWPMHLYGDGPMRQALQASSPALCLHGNVIMEQHWPDIGLLCISSTHEGLPLAALEAMAHGIPVASYAVGGMPALIEQDKTGWLVPPGDRAALEQVVSDWLQMSTARRHSLAQDCRQRIKQSYSVCAQLPAFLSVYQLRRLN